MVDNCLLWELYEIKLGLSAIRKSFFAIVIVKANKKAMFIISCLIMDMLVQQMFTSYQNIFGVLMIIWYLLMISVHSVLKLFSLAIIWIEVVPAGDSVVFPEYLNTPGKRFLIILIFITTSVTIHFPNYDYLI